MDMFEKALAGFDLSAVQLVVYKAAFGLNSSPASRIAKKAALNRAYTYDVLSSLVKCGLVQEEFRNKVKHFRCVPPRELISALGSREQLLSQQKQQLLDALPKLESFSASSANQPISRYFQGIEGIKKMLDETLREQNITILSFEDSTCVLSEVDSEFAHWKKKYTKRRVEQGIWHYRLLGRKEHNSPKQEENETNKTKAKYLFQNDLPADIIVYGPCVAFLSTKNERSGIIIENPHVAETLRCIHQALWSSL